MNIKGSVARILAVQKTLWRVHLLHLRLRSLQSRGLGLSCNDPTGCIHARNIFELQRQIGQMCLA